MTVDVFRVEIPPAVVDDLRQRLSKTRFVRGSDNTDWDLGTSSAYLAELCDYWMQGFDWPEQQERLNAFDHFRAEVDGVNIHFIHAKAKRKPSRPILLLHGWPNSFVRFLKLIPMLTDPQADADGQPAFDVPAFDVPAFDVIVPSLPGFGFSDRPRKQGSTFGFGDLLHKLVVEELGYRRFVVHGGDWGGMVAEQLARSHSASVTGIHLTDVPFFHMFQKPGDLSSAEKAYLKRMEAFQQKEGAYALIQSTRPQSLAFGLNDSPAGLAAWIVEKFRNWSDCDGDLESRFSKDEILTNIMIYWATQTIDSSFFPYFDLANAGALRWISETVKGWLGSTEVPTGFAIFPKDLVTPPRQWAERFFRVTRWTEMPRGGHFAAMEEPKLLAQELRAMFGQSAAASRSEPERALT